MQKATKKYISYRRSLSKQNAIKDERRNKQKKPAAADKKEKKRRKEETDMTSCLFCEIPYADPRLKRYRCSK